MLAQRREGFPATALIDTVLKPSAININRSGTRGEDLLIEPELLQKIWILRKLLHGMDEIGAMEFLLDKMKNTKSNDEFFASMKR